MSEELSLSFSAHLPNSPCSAKGKSEVGDEALRVCTSVGRLCWTRVVEPARAVHLCSILMAFPFLASGSLAQALGGFWLLQGFLPPTREQRMTD